MIAAVAGGLASKWGGGKFANGAITAAFVHLYNAEGDLRSQDRQRIEQLEFERRMATMLTNGHAGIGHRLTYREAIWWWGNAAGKPLIVDGRVLTTDNWMSSLSGYKIVGPDIFDDVRVHGKASVFAGRIVDEMYDFDTQPWGSNPVQWARNVLTPIAKWQNGAGTNFQIRFRYNDAYFQ
jgi:hypothetical protein